MEAAFDFIANGRLDHSMMPFHCISYLSTNEQTLLFRESAWIERFEDVEVTWWWRWYHNSNGRTSWWW